MAQGGRRTRGHPHDEGVVTGGRRSGGNCGGNANERNDGDAVMGWQAGSCAEMGRSQCKAGPATEKIANTDFFLF
jgi:hypothetical protein